MIEQKTTIDGVVIDDAKFLLRSARWASNSKNIFKSNINSMMSAKQTGYWLPVFHLL
jgi:hypothetical protein